MNMTTYARYFAQALEGVHVIDRVDGRILRFNTARTNFHPRQCFGVALTL